MTDRDALAGLRQALAAIEVMMRSGRFDTRRLADLARDARRHSESLARAIDRRAGDSPVPVRESVLEQHPVP
ncbi:hypothetical protein [Phreatobacter sp.]|uniref:hypothetical protein n=1 Tax=Phreatobacter sp. TaxID=1966341 RepID=UPI003F6FD6A4